MALRTSSVPKDRCQCPTSSARLTCGLQGSCRRVWTSVCLRSCALMSTLFCTFERDGESRECKTSCLRQRKTRSAETHRMITPHWRPRDPNMRRGLRTSTQTTSDIGRRRDRGRVSREPHGDPGQLRAASGSEGFRQPGGGKTGQQDCARSARDRGVRDHLRRRCRDGPVRGSPQVAPPMSANPAPQRPEPSGHPVGITPRWGLSSLDWHARAEGAAPRATNQGF
jgi:hypothetical protein